MSGKAKIIFTVTTDLNYDQRMIRICTSLSNTGYDILLIGRILPTSPPLVKQSYRQHRITCFFNKGKLFYLEYNIRLFFYLLSARFDILSAVDLDTLIPAYWLAKLKGKTCVYDAHEYFTEVPEVIGRPKVKWIWEKIANYLIPKVKYCYTVGEQLAKIMSERYETSFKVIRNVPFRMSPDKVKLPAAENRILLYQGALNEGRGLEELIYAVKELDKVELWIVGEGDLSTDLRKLSEKLGLNEKVRFLGYIQPFQLKEITPQASVGLNLLENKGLSYYYSLANKTFDYIQSGLPAIHMNFPEYESLNNQYQIGVLVESLEIEVLKNAIRSLLDRPVHYHQIQQNCLSAAKELCWENETDQLNAFYQQILKP